MKYTIKTISQLGNALKSLRKSRGLTQQEASAKVGLFPKTVSAMETCSSRSTIESLMKLLAALDCDLILIPREENKNSNSQEW